ncbi:unnamed protein product [Rotaria socialis]|uniref:G-protein coupled receptors family 1 profile domain-containing protein n=1 Tax=Rotaria socialis TaxID=392032 RepID=A0A817Y9G5_9BILA|nr:unnamed protein product [Rotaria socialis]CAF3557650.1 unnamed protein product [Rotaria socialis]CAF3684989.1 unnamed protein product [Rotaria socialis]CAF4646345.1 unnamed protein product [Rotaria socialis]CAF4904340.1 unnamed protein product [Rotaria socialis]
MNVTISETENLVVFKRLIEGYLLSFVCIIGLIGNSITCVSILINQIRRSSPTDIYICGLSFISMFVLSGFLLTHGIRALFNVYGEIIHRSLFTIVFPAHLTCLLIQIYLTTAISIDRFLLICYWRKLSYRKWRTPKRIIYIIISIIIFAIIYCLPFWFEHVVIDNQYISLSTIGSQPLFRLLMRKYLYFIFVFLLPMSCIMICTLSIIHTLCNLSKNKYRNRPHSFQRNNRSRKIHTLLLLIMIIFLLTQLPYFLFNVIYALQGPNFMENLRARQFLVINNLLASMNASTTFILYALFGTKKQANHLQNV